MLGVTPPISSDPPKDTDVQASLGERYLLPQSSSLTPVLEKDLRALKQYESEAEGKIRSVVEVSLRAWACVLMTENVYCPTSLSWSLNSFTMSPSSPACPRRLRLKLVEGSIHLDHIGRVSLIGSRTLIFSLGVHGPGSDIDTICVCPRHIYREHFFGEFKQMLRDWPAVTEISVRLFYTIQS